METDLQMIEKAAGPGTGFNVIIKDQFGVPDDLTVYNLVRMVIRNFDYSGSPVLVRVDTDPEITVDASGNFLFEPSNSNPVPAFGFYFVQIFRETTVGDLNQPVKKFTLLTTRALDKT